MNLFTTDLSAGCRRRASPIGPRPGRRPSPAGRTLGPGGLWVALLVCRLPSVLVGAERDDELTRRQATVRELLDESTKRMETLAKELSKTEPEEAVRVREAADRVRTAGLGALLEEISRLLSSSSFEEAVLRQDVALKELDGIIAILEQAKFRDAERSSELEANEAARRAVAQLAAKQEGLLRKTRQNLGTKDLKDLLERLGGELSRLEKEQAGMNEGRSEDDGSTGADDQALERAAGLVDKLLEGQERVSRRGAELAPEASLLGEKRAVLEEIERLLEGARAMAAGSSGETADAGAGAQPGGTTEPRGTTEPGKTEPGKTEPGKTEPGKTEPGKTEPGKTEPGKTEPGKTEPGKTEPGKTEPGGAEPGEGATNGAEAARKGSESPGGKAAAGKEPAGGGAEPPKPRAGAPTDPRELVDRVRRLAADVARGASGEPPDEIRQGLEDAAREGGKALESAPEARAPAVGKAASSGLERARDAARRAARAAEDRAARSASSVAQEQGLLEKESSEGSSQLGDEGRKASTEAGREALSRAGSELGKAAESMKSAADGMSRGETREAGDAAAEARRSLERARTALEEGRKKLAARTADEKAADRQRGLARRADEAREEVQRLQKKLGRKDPPQDARLREAEAALERAGQAMREGAAAREEGNPAGAKSRGEQAGAELGEARKKIAEVAKSAPEPETLEGSAKEQDELARLTRQTARKLETGSNASQTQATSVDSAAGNMERAGQSLSRNDAAGAEKEQQEALDRLRGTREALEKEAQELARLNREQQVISVAEELSEIRRGQEEIHRETVELDAKRGKDESRRDRLKLQGVVERLATSQGGLSDRVEALREKLKAELSRVFFFQLGNIGTDMRQVRDSLGELELGSYTQFLQKSVLDDLDQLIQALKDELDRLKQTPPSQSPPSEAAQPLVPIVAELRMLKEMQIDVNRKTRNLEDLKKASEGRASDAWQRSLDRLLQKQGAVSRLTGELVEDFEKASRAAEASGEEGGGGEDEPGGEGDAGPDPGE